MSSDATIARPGFWTRLARLWRRAPAPPPPPSAFVPLFPARAATPSVEPVAAPPEALPPEALRPDEQAALDRLARLLAGGETDAAAALVEQVFAARPEARDPVGHPAYLKARLRVALAGGQRAAWEEAAAALRRAAQEGDPVADIIAARHLEAAQEPAAARRHWAEVARLWPHDAEARAALARWQEGAPPLPRGVEWPAVPMLSDLAPLARTVDAFDFGSATLQRLEVAPPAPPAARLPVVPGSERFAPVWIPDWHGAAPALPARPLNCYMVPDLIVSGMGGISGQYWVDGQLCIGLELMPKYIHGMCQIERGGAPLIRSSASLPTRTIDAPCIVLAGAGMRVYGHFILEMLPRLMTARQALGPLLAECRCLIDRDAPGWLARMLTGEVGVPAERLEYYRFTEERVRLRRAVLPGYAFQEDGYHPAAGPMFDAFLASLPPCAPPVPQRRLFVARPVERNPNTPPRICRNQADLARIAAERHGFAIVSPETLPWRQQIALFENADIVAGLAGSGMHATLFSPPGTAVAQLGVMSLAQSQIGSLRRQRNAFLAVDMTAVTKETNFEYEIDPAQFTAFLDAVVAGAERT